MFRGGAKNDTEGTSGSVTKPGGTIDGDVVLLWTISNAFPASAAVTTWPSGFVEDSLSPITLGNLDGSVIRWAWKVASGEGASWSITSSHGSTRRGCGVWSGRSITTPVHRISARADVTGQASPWTATSSAFSSNTTKSDCDIGFLQSDDAGSTPVVHTAPTNFTLQVEHGSGGTDCNGALSTRDGLAAGETGVYSGTGTKAATSADLAIVAFALAPADSYPGYNLAKRRPRKSRSAGQRV